MNRRQMKRFYVFIAGLFLLTISFPAVAPAQKFIHPGIDQTKEDLEYMKNQVLKGEQPWKEAFDKLISLTDLNFKINPCAHVLRGPYGKPDIGGDDLSKSSNMAYNCALLWYITDDRAWARKAIDILDAWSPVLWDFDYNDAKLLAGWTGHLLCNAAEILRYTDSGWTKEGQDRFTRMLMTVYYPLMRNYYPQANGNWDGAIIHSIMAIAVFTDNREMFGNAVDHFLHAPVNGSIFKYIYPSGQCQETMRDQGHVQLGLGEFAGAARVAFTQGVDLFSLAGNRIALGYEYTAQFLMGSVPHSYGRISERAKDLRDDYEYVYRHYTAAGIEMPYTKMAADSVRPKTSRSVLTAFRVPKSKPVIQRTEPKPSPIAWPAGAMDKAVTPVPAHAIRVTPGQSLQKALDEAAGRKGWVVATAGVHKFPETLKISSGVTLSGEGLKTILMLDPESGLRDAIVNANSNMHDVTICDLVIEAATDPEPASDPNSNRSYRARYNRGGIMFPGQKEDDMKNITIKNITVRNSTYNGVFISGASAVTIDNCDFDENGAGVVPGPKLQHNLLLRHCSEVTVKNSRLDTSPNGSGIALDRCDQVSIGNCEVARNGFYGILISESDHVTITSSLIEANDKSGVMAEFLYDGCGNITLNDNLVHYNNGYGIETYKVKDLKYENNRLTGNGNSVQQELISDEKRIMMN